MRIEPAAPSRGDAPPLTEAFPHRLTVTFRDGQRRHLSVSGICAARFRDPGWSEEGRGWAVLVVLNVEHAAGNDVFWIADVRSISAPHGGIPGFTAGDIFAPRAVSESPLP